MSYTHLECAAILRRELRSKRYRYRHNLSSVAVQLGIPESWIRYWISEGRLRAKEREPATWVRLEDVQQLFEDAEAIQDAFWETADPVTSPRTIEILLTKWPRLPKRMCRPPKVAEHDLRCFD